MALVITETLDGVARIQMNRPEKKNALTVEMYQELTAAFHAAEAEAAVRCLLWHGVPEAFTAGNDLKDFAAQPPADTNAPAFQFMRTVFGCKKPVVAAVTGLAIGIGVTLLPYCEMVFAADNTRFQMPFIDLGLVPEAGSTSSLPAQCGYHAAADLLLTGRPFSAAEALGLGLVTKVLPPAEVLSAASEAAKLLAGKPPAALRLTKQLLRQGWAAAASAAMTAEGPHFLACLNSPEAKEAFAAFFEKRKPDFSKCS